MNVTSDCYKVASKFYQDPHRCVECKWYEICARSFSDPRSDTTSISSPQALHRSPESSTNVDTMPRYNSAAQVGLNKPVAAPDTEKTAIVRHGGVHDLHEGIKGTETAASSQIDDFPYPDLPLDLSNITHEQLVDRSENLASQYRKRKDYLAVRDEYLFISFALNQFGLLAPLFREQPRIPFLDKDRNQSHDQLLIDQIVIDFHWIWSRGDRVASSQWTELKRLFSKDYFDCTEVAESYAHKKWTSDFRAAEMLCLTRRQQVQLVQLRNNGLKEQYRRLIEGKSGYDSVTRRSKRTRAKFFVVRSTINDYVDRNHRLIGQEKVYEALWLARELLHQDASLAQIAELVALQLGVKPLAPKTVSDKLVVLDKILSCIEPSPGVNVGP